MTESNHTSQVEPSEHEDIQTDGSLLQGEQFDQGVAPTNEKRKRPFLNAKSILFLLILVPLLLILLFNGIKELELRSANAKIKRLTQSEKSETTYEDIKQLYLAIKKRDALQVRYSGIERAVKGLAREEKSSASLNDTSNSGSGNSGTVSSTNVQVDGVDEADIVKTNGETIYSVSPKPYPESVSSDGIYLSTSLIQIIATHRTGEMKLLKTLEIEGNVTELYLKDDKLIVLKQEREEYLDKKENKKISIREYFDRMRALENNSDEKSHNEFYGNYILVQRTSALIYDVSKPDNPVLLREFSQDGYYQSSRLIKDNLYLITNAAKDSQGREVTIKENEVDISQIIPSTKDSANGNKDTLLPTGCISILPNPDSYQFTVISGLNISQTTEAKTIACLGGSSQIYASEKFLYIVAPEYVALNDASTSKMMIDIAMPFPDKSTIKKISLNNGNPKLYASGSIPGGILNQFSLDEFQEHLRIAVTEYKEKQTNSVFVLNDKLETVGKIENLAPEEKIYSVRFMGEKGYVVTYKQIDPLFALDLKDPKNPKVTGELKIPGFSEYLHPYSENLLIGIGNDTTSNGYGGEMRNGMKLSMFDVSDPFNPKEVQSLPIGDQSSYSEILYSHKALFYSKEKNLIGFPVQSYTSNGVLNEFQVFKIQENKGFELAGSITQKPTNWRAKYYPENGIQRGVLIDDSFYTISTECIKQSSIDTFQMIHQIDFSSY